jgi:hypothetical protein
MPPILTEMQQIKAKLAHQFGRPTVREAEKGQER